MAKRTTIQEFESIFPKLEAALLEHAQSYKLPQKETDWYKLVRAHLNSAFGLSSRC